ncbi:MAG: lysine--tRNA ligase [Deltaproteobacteria bacterium]|nr:lysine--tRNA ligase [Deltaproteobacteria bacterium]
MAVRRDKIDALRQSGRMPYAERFQRSHGLAQAKRLEAGTKGVRIAGRVVAIRLFGKLAFGKLYDFEGEMQFSLKKNLLDQEFKLFQKMVDTGDFVGLEGEIWVTKTAEVTLDVHRWTFLSKALRPLPEKFHGLADKELKLRRRYLDLISSDKTRHIFRTRTRIVKTIREFLDEHGFTEIDTPVLSNKASGALARPFVTHSHALDIDVYLRIAPETYLKRAIAGGFDKVYEFARSFRNEGVDGSHLPDFTLLEAYSAYWNYLDNMSFTEKLIRHVLQEVSGALSISYQGTAISFEGQWPAIGLRDLILKDSDIDIDAYPTKEALLSAVTERAITLESRTEINKVSRATLVDLLYKKVSRPKIIDPLFIIEHPLDLSPLARKNDRNPSVVDRFQLVVNGWEIVNGYSELVDPIDQADRFVAQAGARSRGDEETMEIDMDFLRCMEYGMPPTSGWGMGVDRMVALLTDASTLRDVVLFPLLRPE